VALMENLLRQIASAVRGHLHHSDPTDAEAHHRHVHGVADPAYVTSERGLWALKWSFAILGAGALLQLAVVMLSGSMALLADMIHNLTDAATAVPLAIAFVALRRAPTARFTHGYGRLEDLAGAAIVLAILASAIVVAYEAVQRLIAPHSVAMLGAVAAAGIIGFLANEVVAVLRIRVGNEIHSAALIADGNHARADGLASLAVVAGAGAMKLGFPAADPLIGLVIGVMIGAIVWRSASTVFTRMLDGVEPGIVDDIRDASRHFAEICEVANVRARWIGHRLDVDVEIALDSTLCVHDAIVIAKRFERAAIQHLPAPADVHVVIAEKPGQR
jgi:cation diffusion facilitator family transporter